MYVGEEIQGTFMPQTLNIAFVFQVNCPGCFIYGLPLMNNLYEDLGKKLGFIGVSTAFEDFEYNTPNNTKLLLSEGITIGETMKYLVSRGEQTYSDIPKFPVVFDEMVAARELDWNVLMDRILAQYEGVGNWTAPRREMAKQQIYNHYIGLEGVAKTFTMNQLRGTPSFILFNADYDVLFQSFGHIQEDALRDLLKQLMLKQS